MANDDIWVENETEIDRLLLDEAAELSLLVELDSLSIVGARGAAAGLLGVEAPTLVGKPVATLAPVGSEASFGACFEIDHLQQPGGYGELLVAKPAGGLTTVSLRVEHLKARDGRSLCLLRALDVSERVRMSGELRRYHGALQQAYRRLKEQEQSLSEARRAASLQLFAAGLGHELNNPVAAATANAASLVSAVDEMLEALPDAAKRPSELVMLQDIAKDLNLCVTRVATVVRRLSELEARVVKSAFDVVPVLKTETSRTAGAVYLGPERLVLETDAGAVRRLLAPLLDNAVRAAPGKPVTVTLEVKDEGLSLSVDDEGPGIPADLRDRVFDPFFSTRPPGEGLGLGLFLARRAATILGGQLELEARPGAGTRAMARFPQKLPEQVELRRSYEGLRSGVSEG